MALKPGTRQGSYEILSPLGAGGMGEVYRARDLRLGREVALKALPEELAQDAERTTRFEREARMLASLNHPNIAAIYGLEDAPGQKYLVLECVEGETLAEKLAAGPLPVEEALAICGEIAAGLAAAHEAGVIHRDVKPGNVKVRPDGSVKVLDFGLARHGELSERAADQSLSPTVTSPATATGVILGTAAYMSPEQARGKALDERSDIFSFGCVLYECLSGKQAFRGETVSDTLAAILKSEPDWGALPAETPLKVRDLLKRCLQKDPKRRLHDIADARLEIEEALSEGRAGSGRPALLPAAPSSRRNRLFWALAGGIIGAAAAATLMKTLPTPSGPASAPSIRAVLPLPAGTELRAPYRPAVAISPDGKTVVFQAVGQGRSRLFRRRLDRSEAEPIAGTEGATDPFFSPDGEWLAFFTPYEMRKVPIAGGSPVSICAASPVASGGAWDPDGSIVFALTSNRSLVRVPASGGEPKPATTLDSSRGEHAHLWPQVLPEGRGILLSIVLGHDFQDLSASQIAVIEPASGTRRVILEGATFARYAEGGWILFVRGGSLFAQRFDLSRLRVTGSPIPVQEPVALGQFWRQTAHFALSPEGTLAFIAGPSTAEGTTELLRLDRQGRETRLPLPSGVYENLRRSPDGRRIVLTRYSGPSGKLFVFDRERQVLSPLTPEPGRFFSPVWSPDGRRIAFTRYAAGLPQACIKAADGSGEIARLTSQTENAEFPTSFSPDGKTLAYTLAYSPLGKGPRHRLTTDIWLVSLDGREPPRPWFTSPYWESAAQFSPDGRFLAYVSDESDRKEVYVRPVEGAGGRLKVSSDGGAEPAWSRNGREILYREGNRFLSVELRTEGELTAAAPRLLFEAKLDSEGDEAEPIEYAVSPDGGEILARRTTRPEELPRQLAIVTRFLEALERAAGAH